MATAGENNLNGVDVQKTAVGFADDMVLVRKFCNVVPASATEIRYYQKTSGFISSPSTSGITSANMRNSAKGALPNVIEQSLTRATAYVKKYFKASPLLTDEDIKSAEPDIFALNITDITQAVMHEEDLDLYNVLTEDQTAVNINTQATAAPWNTASFTSVDIVADLSNMEQKIQSYFYDTSNKVLLLNSTDYNYLKQWLITQKGTSIPNFTSQQIKTGVVAELLGWKISVNEAVVADSAVGFIPNLAMKVKEFTSLTTGIVEHVGMGKEIRVWLESVGILEHPRAVCLLTNLRT